MLVGEIGAKCVNADRLLRATAVTGITQVPYKVFSQQGILTVAFLTCHVL